MARKLSPLTASLVLDINKWTAGIQQVKRDEAAIVKSLKPVVDATKQLGTAFVAAGALVGGALLGMAKKAADYGDEMLEASQKTGINTKQLAALRLVAEQSGSSFEGVTSAVTKLSRTMFDAASKGGDAAKVFAALGISVKDSTGHVREASDVLPIIAERFANMKDGSEKTALAIKLFGKAGADLIPTLNQGAEGFKRAAEAVEKYNVDIGVAGSKLGDELNDSLKETGLATQGLANQIGVALLPAMIKLVALVNNTIAAVSGLAKAHPGWTQAIAATAGILTGAGGLLLGLTALLVVLPKIESSIFLIKAAIVSTNPVVLALYGAVAAVTTAFIAFPEIRKPVLDTLQQLYQGATLLISAFTNLAFVEFKLKTGGITEAWTALKNLPTNVIDDIVASGERFNRFVSTAGGMGKAFDIGDISKDVKKAVGEMGVNMDAFGKETKDAATEVDRMWKALQRETQEASDLEEVLKKATKANISEHVILEKLGHTIRQVAAESRLYGEKLGPVTARLAKMQDALELVNKSWEMQADLIKSVNEAASLTEFDPSILLPPDLTMPTGPLSAKIIGSQMARDWGEIFGRISDDLVDMIVDFDFSFRRIGDIAKNAAKSLMGSFLDGFFKPFKDSLAGLGESLGSALSKVVLGSGGLNGILSKIPGIGGIFGGGALVAGVGGGAAAGTAAGGATTAAGSGAGVGLGSLAFAGPAALFALPALLFAKLGKDSPFGALTGSIPTILQNKKRFDELHKSGVDFDKLATDNPGLTAAEIFRLADTGSALTKAGATVSAPGSPVSLTVNVSANFTLTEEVSELYVRDVIVPAFLAEAKSGVRGVAEELRQIINGPMGSTPAVQGI